MTQSNTLASRVTAALSALALSLVMITATAVTPSTAQVQNAAYVGVVA